MYQYMLKAVRFILSVYCTFVNNGKDTILSKH
jgi:hypothetical protein